MRTNFIDTNVLVYFAAADETRFSRAEAIVTAGGLISVQVLNEFTDVLRRKMQLTWIETEEALHFVKRALALQVAPLTIDTQERAVAVAKRHNLRIYDGMIIASALEHRCDTLYSEDMQHGLVVEGRLTIVNPFLS